jgi:hypothetical protein
MKSKLRIILSVIVLVSGNILFGTGMDVINVLDYGATPDDASDDTAEIQAALDAATNGGVVFMPKGKYVVTATLKINNGRVLTGEGMGATVIEYNGAGETAIENSSYSNPNSQFSLRDFTIMAITYGYLGRGIRLNGYWISIANIEVIGANSATGAVRLENCEHVEIKNAVLNGYNGGSAGAGTGICLYNTKTCDIYVNISGFTNGIQLSNASRNNNIFGSIKGITEHAVLISDSNYNRVKCGFDNCSARWVFCTGTTSYNKIEAYRNSDTGIPAYPVFLDTNTLYNVICTPEAIMTNTYNYFSFGSSFYMP